MKDYVSSCGFPTVNVSGITIPRLILGHLPFIGESYQGPERNREYKLRFLEIDNIQNVLRVAIEKFGATVTSAGTLGENEELASLHFQAIEAIQRVTGNELAFIPCVQIPLIIGSNGPVDVFRRWLTYYNIEQKKNPVKLLEKYLEDPILQCRSNWKEKFTEALNKSKPYTSNEIRNLQISYEKLEKQLSFIKNHKALFVEVGSESDFLAMTGRLDLLSELISCIQNKCGLKVIAGVHHAGSTIPILEQHSIGFVGYVTPINKLGIMMFPDPGSALKVIKGCSKPVIAIKPLGGGGIPPRDAFNYVYRDVGVASCMVGVASKQEVEVDLTIALEVLQSLN